MSHKPVPLISIIVALYNGAITLQKSIDCVAQQTYPNKELIIVEFDWGKCSYSRFGRLQDHLGNKLLPRFVSLVGESSKTLLDTLVHVCMMPKCF